MARRPIVVLPVMAALASLITGCSSTTALMLSGKVLDESEQVQVPSLVQPRVNLDAGFVSTTVGVGRPAGGLSSVPAAVGLGSFVRVARVEVSLGQRVTAGQPLLRLDDAQLKADVVAAKADAAVSASQVAVLESGIKDTEKAEADLADARAKALDARDKLTATRRQLSGKLAQARGTLAQLPGKLTQVQANLEKVNAQRTALMAQLAALPPLAPPEARAQLTAGIAQLSAARSQLEAARGQLLTAIGTLKKAVPQLTKALAKLDAGLATVASGLRKIAAGKAKLLDARQQLRALKKLAVVAAGGGKLGVDIARTLRTQAVLTAPADGIVTGVAATGDLLAPGATAATVRPEAHRVLAWLAPDQVAHVCLGDTGSMSADWLATPVSLTLTRIGDAADYPPTSQPTDQVHLTRAVPIELTLPAGSDLLAGVPVDVQLAPCRPAGATR